MIHIDIKEDNSYVCVNDAGEIIGTFYYIEGKDIKPTYINIEDGAWIDDGVYGVVHRLASDGSEKGIGKFCIDWAFNQCSHLRVDTHPDNKVMQNLLTKLGFKKCGIIHVIQDNYPRCATIFSKSRFLDSSQTFICYVSFLTFFKINSSDF